MQRSVTGSIIEIQCKSAEKLHFHIIRRLLSIIFHFYNPKALKHHIFRSSRTSHCNFLSFFPPNYYNVFFCIEKIVFQEYPTSLLKPYDFLLQNFFFPSYLCTKCSCMLCSYFPSPFFYSFFS